MFGGFMSQSIVVPELDGAVCPYVVNDQEPDEEGVYLFRAIPERLRDFTQIVGNFVRLKRMPNAGKKVAIYYFKGAGQASLTAQGLETVPSLYNLLRRLKAEGYKVERLPATEKEFEKLLMTQGAVLSTYAEGAFDDFMKNGRPAWVPAAEYESWVERAMPEELYADVVKIYGEAPGSYMSAVRDGVPSLAVARIELGQCRAAAAADGGRGRRHVRHRPRSEDGSAAHLHCQLPLVALRLRRRCDDPFRHARQSGIHAAETGGPERLRLARPAVGTVPHFYFYTIGNVGESMMAKRRAYATTVSYLTPPFTESKTRGQYKELENKIENYYKAGEDGRGAGLRWPVKRLAVEMGLHRDLRLDSVLTRPYAEADIARIENFAEEIANEKITGQLYTAGVPYAPEKIRSSVMAMSVDPIAYSWRRSTGSADG